MIWRMKMSTKSLMVGAAVVALALTGCGTSSAQSGGEQTTEAACEMIYDGLSTLEAELAEVGGSDTPEDLKMMLEIASANLDRLDTEVTNPEVKAVWTPIAELQRAGLQAAADEDEESLMAAYLEMSEKYEDFVKVCPADGEAQSEE